MRYVLYRLPERARVEWIKRKIRGTLFFRILRRALGYSALNRSSNDNDSNSDYDQQTVEVMRRVLRSESCCIDIGAHKGDLLRHMVDLAPDGRHYAFEALPHLAAELRQRFPGVQVYDQAIGDVAGHAEFHFVENAPGYSGLRRRIYDRPDPLITTIQVRVIPLDEVVPSDQPIAFIKIDIEGGEYHALKGAIRTILQWKPVIVFEAGIKSTGQYNVTPTQLFGLVSQTLGYDLSTMRRWMNRLAPYTLAEFCDNWESGSVYYFMATPNSLHH